MTTKKFVKSNMFSSQKYTEKQDKPDRPERAQKQVEKPTWNSEYNKRPKQYAEKGADNYLRKYFESVSITALQQLQNLINTFPMFFSESSQGCQSANNKHYGKSQRIIHNAKVSEEQQNISWDSDGQIQLGAGLNKTALKKYEGVAPLKTNQLKRYQKQFLQDQLRQKAQEEQRNKKLNNTTIIQQKVNIKKAPIQSDSDDQIQIVKTTNYQTSIQQAQVQHKSTPSMSQNIATDSEGQIDRFNSDSSESDDIFGENSEKSEEEKKNQQQPSIRQVGFGSVQFAKGQFGVFALSQGLKQDDQVWTIIDRLNNTKKLSSTQMDRDYKNLYLHTYPWMTFSTYSQYVDYFIFMPKQLNNYQNKFDQTKKKRKFSTNQQYSHGEDNNNNQRNRMNSAIYKPKKSNNNS